MRRRGGGEERRRSDRIPFDQVKEDLFLCAEVFHSRVTSSELAPEQMAKHLSDILLGLVGRRKEENKKKKEKKKKKKEKEKEK